MGQAASMCRFKGCRYKKSKSGLQLRSIEEPHHHHPHHHHHSNHNHQPQPASPPNSADGGGPAGQRMPADASGAGVQQPQPQPHLPGCSSSGGSGGNGSGHAQPAPPQPPPPAHQQHHHHHNSLPHQLQHQHQQPPSNHQYQQHNSNEYLGANCNSQSCYNPEYARMESWMDENPEFVQDYFIRKATRQIVDSWLVSHATTSACGSHGGHGHGGHYKGGHGHHGHQGHGPTCCNHQVTPPGGAIGAGAGHSHADCTGQSAAGGCQSAGGMPNSPSTASSPGGGGGGGGHHAGHSGCGQSCSSRSGSGATTPVRKISAHEFERGGLLKPIVNTIDGTPTFLSVAGGGSTVDMAHSNQQHPNSNHHSSTSSSADTCSQSANGLSNSSSSNGTASGSGATGSGSLAHSASNNSSSSAATSGTHLSSSSTSSSSASSSASTGRGHPQQRLSRNELRHLDEKQLIFELVKDICNELDVRSLCHKILQNVSILLKADRGSLFLVEGRPADTAPKKCLVSKLFDVCPRSTVADMDANAEVCVTWGTGIAGYVADSGEPVNIPDAYADARFNDAIDSRTGYRTQALLCMPIKDCGGEVLGVAQVINKLNGDRFTEADEKVFAKYLQFCGIGLRNAQLYEQSQLEIKRNQVLLDLARMIFEEQSTIEMMVLRILTHMQSLIQCQRVQILLVHEASKGSFSRVFDFEANDLCKDDCQNRTSPFESRFPINIGVTGHVATTGETVNIVDAYADQRFDAAVDDGQLFKHRSILCMAIKNSLGQIIGVIQLVNKFNRLNFTRNDENFVEAFAIFCGMGIHNTHMYEKAIVAMAKQSVTLEVLSYHASATVDDAGRLKCLKIPSSAHFQLHDFRFDDILMDDDDTLRACLRMFLDMDFVNRFHIDYEVLCRWLLSVKKNYRNVTYHNWRHAFNVAQMMFSILTSTQWWKIFGEIECLALIIACLCHDLDHRGTNNSFQIKASSPLAQLYSTSTMEHHHFDQCLMILNSPGNQVLSNLSSDDYSQVIHVLEDAILSTDLAVYFRKRGAFLQQAAEQRQAAGAMAPAPVGAMSMSYWCADEPRQLLRAMSMTVCDLSAITKPWPIEKRTADLVSSEFFEQGDIERHELNIMPIDIMNREMEDQLPMMQVGFIDSICMPIYEAFSVLSGKLEPLVEGVRENKHQWLLLAEAADAKNKKKQLQQQQQQKIIVHNSSNNNTGSGEKDSEAGSEELVDEDESHPKSNSKAIHNNNNNNISSASNHNNNNIMHTKRKAKGTSATIVSNTCNGLSGADETTECGAGAGGTAGAEDSAIVARRKHNGTAEHPN